MKGSVLGERDDVRALIDAAPVAIYTVSPDGIVMDWNPAAERMFGWSRAEAVGTLLPIVPPEALDEYHTLRRHVLEGRPFAGLELRRRHKDGSMIDLNVATTALFGPDGAAAAVIGFAQDVTGLKRAERELREQYHQLRVILDAIPSPVFYKDEAGIYRGCNAAFERFVGKGRERIVGSALHEVEPPDLAEVSRAADAELLRRGGAQAYESSVLDAEGSRRDVIFNKAAFHKADGSVGGLVGTILDITERKQAERALSHQAFHDPLTGLPNRALFNDRMERALSLARRQGDSVAVAFVDLDRFKWVNDTLGHDAGDTVLKSAAQRLSACLRDSDTLARLGGDEFIALLPCVRDDLGAARAADRMVEALEVPLAVHGQEVRLSASVGVAIFPRDADDAETLLRNADVAMYRAKQSGKNGYALYAPGDASREQTRLRRAAQLHRALERGELVVHYQPVWSVPGRELCGFEALVRWQHPELGLLAPSEFVPLAEQSGLIARLGAWVLAEACRQAVAWERAGLDAGSVAVNVSALQFDRPDFVRQVSSVLASTGMKPANLVLELTESAMSPTHGEPLRQLGELRGMGVRLAVDDFGTGYSNLGALRRLPVDVLKIDQTFVRDLGQGEEARFLVQAMVALARGLGKSLVAEGVENSAQLELLESLGCPRVQGYFLARPAPASDAERWMRSGAAVSRPG